MRIADLRARLSDWLRREWRIVAGAGIVFLVAFGYHYATEFRVEPMLAGDGYVHTKIAWLYATGESPILGHDFPWTRYSIYNTMRHDWELLYHLALIPFLPFGLATGGKLSAVLFAALLLATAYTLLRLHGVRYAWLFTFFLLFASPALIWRWHLPRPTTLFLVFFLILAHALVRKRAVAVLVLTTICMWIYNIPQNPIVLGVVVFVVHTLRDRRPPWRTGAALALGLVIGVVVHPGFWVWDGSVVEPLPGLKLPQNGTLQQWRQIRDSVEAAATDGVVTLEGVEVDLGLPVELLDSSTRAVLNEGGLTLGLLAATFLAALLVPRRASRIAVVFLAMSAIYFYLLLTSMRFFEYWIPFAVLGCAFALRGMLEEPPKTVRASWSGLVASWKRAPAATLLVASMTGGALLATGLASAHNARAAHERLVRETDRFAPWYEGAMSWLEENTSPGELVFHTDWDDFGPMFFYNHHNHYLVGFLPNFFSMYDAQRFLLWKRITAGELDPAATVAAIRSFDARHVLITHQVEWQRLYALLSSAPGVERVYVDRRVSVFRLPPGR